MGISIGNPHPWHRNISSPSLITELFNNFIELIELRKAQNEFMLTVLLAISAAPRAPADKKLLYNSQMLQLFTHLPDVLLFSIALQC